MFLRCCVGICGDVKAQVQHMHKYKAVFWGAWILFDLQQNDTITKKKKLIRFQRVFIKMGTLGTLRIYGTCVEGNLRILPEDHVGISLLTRLLSLSPNNQG